MPLQFSRFGDMPLQFAYSERCHYNFLLPCDLPFCMYLMPLDPFVGTDIFVWTRMPLLHLYSSLTDSWDTCVIPFLFPFFPDPSIRSSSSGRPPARDLKSPRRRQLRVRAVPRVVAASSSGTGGRSKGVVLMHRNLIPRSSSSSASRPRRRTTSRTRDIAGARSHPSRGTTPGSSEAADTSPSFRILPWTMMWTPLALTLIL
jgi:hypothetical protein